MHAYRRTSISKIEPYFDLVEGFILFLSTITRWVESATNIPRQQILSTS